MVLMGERPEEHGRTNFTPKLGEQAGIQPIGSVRKRKDSQGWTMCHRIKLEDQSLSSWGRRGPPRRMKITERGAVLSMSALRALGNNRATGSHVGRKGQDSGSKREAWRGGLKSFQLVKVYQDCIEYKDFKSAFPFWKIRKNSWININKDFNIYNIFR